ncbi:MBOAT family O-acyltransferase [Leeuwenhoekiella sp. NPDC079379]|uniref:MBOAT family O-acyltransferase n=1 Tax=Leeuwenhoekiella sp. NPDC079379 TaxID=3364122 RepID=UPI0037C85662
MLFNSIEFGIFLPLVFLLYWFVFNKSLRIQNFYILIISYIFYGWWDWRFLGLIAFSSAIDYFVGNALIQTNKDTNRKFLLFLSMSVNLGFLGFFKYYNFFVDSFSDAYTIMGHNIETSRLNIILPVGISFYTFQTMSYTIDVYRKKLKPVNNIVDFFAYVSFFPQLVAGPIERAVNLLPQFYRKRHFSQSEAINGLKQILWGLFKKMVIADNCAKFANIIFNDYQDFSGSTLLLGAVFFTFQIYGDFSGYSDIAIGTARLFGFNLMKNFDFPYFSRDMAEFWRKWHISLSTWFRDYLYIPLGGSRGGLWMQVRNTFIIFIVSGFWHGANWTFIVWGALNAIYFLPLLIFKRNRINIGTVAQNRFFPSLKEFLQMSLTFLLTVLAWIFFRSPTVKDALLYLAGIFSKSLATIPSYTDIGLTKSLILLLPFFIFIEWLGRHDEFAIDRISITWKKPVKYTFYYTIIFLILYYGGEQQQFIYFQF